MQNKCEHARTNGVVMTGSRSGILLTEVTWCNMQTFTPLAFIEIQYDVTPVSVL